MSTKLTYHMTLAEAIAYALQRQLYREMLWQMELAWQFGLWGGDN